MKNIILQVYIRIIDYCLNSKGRKSRFFFLQNIPKSSKGFLCDHFLLEVKTAFFAYNQGARKYFLCSSVME